MEPFRYHVFVCDQHKLEGVPSCAARGSGQVLEALRNAIAVCGLAHEVQVTPCGSLGLCERGPNMIVYPEGVWYSAVQPEDVSDIVRTHFQQGRALGRLANVDTAALRAEIDSNREKMVAALRAKDAAGAVPDDVAQRMRSFQESRVILSAVELDIFTAVGEGATAAEVSATLGTDQRATEVLLNALVGVELLVKRDGIFQNTAITARHFVAGSRDDAREATMHIVNLWRRWSTLTECVRVGTSVIREEPSDPRNTQAFIAAMHRIALERAPQVIRAVGSSGIDRMLDVGGGSAAYSIAFAQANEKLHAEVLDLPAVIPIAQDHIQAAGLSHRIKTRPGDLQNDDLGRGFDLVLVSAICHMLSPDENRDLLRRCGDALAENGQVVIQDFILDPDKTGPKHAALFAINMLVGTRSGGCYNEDEYVSWLREAGFRDVRRIKLPGPSGLIVAVRG